jgi:Glycosyl transferase family 8.
MKAVLCCKKPTNNLKKEWELAMPHFEACLEKEPIIGLKKLLQSKTTQDWVCCALPRIHDNYATDSFCFSNNYDVIFYATCKNQGKSCIIDNSAFDLIVCKDTKSVKRKARNLNLMGFPPINDIGEWTYLDVMEIKDNFLSFDFVAFKRGVAEEIISTKNEKNIFSNNFRIELSKKYKVGICCNRLGHLPINAKHNTDELVELVHDTFKEQPKNQIDEDCVVITAADSNVFVGLQYLIASILLSHDASMIVYDLGLTEDQSKWIESTGCKLVGIKSEDLLMPKGIDGWQTWNKPLYIDMTKQRYVLWIDADACVLRNIRPAFNIIRTESLLLTADNIAEVYTDDPIGCLMNEKPLYDLMPTPSLMIKNHPNAGVFGIDQQSEIGKSIMSTWLDFVEKAAKNNEIKSNCKWFDQGGLLWTLEKLCLTEMVRKDRYWNDGQTWNSFGKNFIGNMSDLLLHLQVINSGIIHFAGLYKPWREDD